MHARHRAFEGAHAGAIEALDRRESGVGQRAQHGLADFAEPKDRDRRVARHVDEPLHHQRLHTACSTLRKNAARPVQQITHAPPCHVQIAAYRSRFVSTLERTQYLVANGVFALRDRVESRGHAQQCAHRGGAVPHAGSHVIGVIRGADERSAKQLRSPRRSRGCQQPLDTRAAFDSNHAGDLFGLEQLMRRPGGVRIEGGERRAHRGGRLAITHADESQRNHGALS